ncbi:efflux RND transporter permease subunit [Geothrix sp. 21YS21S-2]|uniref:efflux RND transporter permease subunit n=1 Tax=Geothrix sp. 21YS21S-2 TaxID=3068893 RepID=UPI0027BA10A6|nr:efflux RND transporter permease subunit [Geothrix sp. 21YS21S-2]
MTDAPKLGLAGRMAKGFLRSKLTPLIVLASLMLGVMAVVLTPREEEPQIIVPMVDLYVPFPGASPREVEAQVTTPLEKRLWGIPGVEYLYGTSRPGMALVTVRFKVNEPQEPSLVKVHQELAAHPEIFPAGAMKPIVRLQTIDDVPFLTLTLHGEGQTPGQLRRMGEVLARELSTVPDTAQARVIGGARRMVRIEPDPDKLRALGMSLAELQPALQSAEAQLPAGALVDHNRRTTLEATGFVLEARELNRLVVGVRNQKPVYLADVASVSDGPDPEPPVVLYGAKGSLENAVTVALSKRAGSNATALSRLALDKVEALRGSVLPRSLKVDVTRDYGETAGDKSNELIEHLLIATLSVIALILLAMGWRSAVVVGVAVPVTLALTLLLTYLLGYTLNRVTLFALIFSIGILVDDAIVVVENIHRHMHLPGPRKSFATTVVEAVDEVGNPTILATFAVIAAILPMAFVRGLMGPYMRPIPIGASLAMIFSLAIAFVISPWAALKIFRKEAHLPEVDETGLHPATDENEPPEPDHDHNIAPEDLSTRIYRKVMRALLTSGKVRLGFLVAVLAMLGGAGALVGTGVVKVKMLPFDNKSEFMVQLDLPAGTPREDSLALGQQLARRLMQEPVVKDVQVYAQEAAPYTFVGMVRHSFLRQDASQVDIQVNLVAKGDRKEQSHAIATRLRPELEKYTVPAGARMKVVEIPPGPPVLDTVVAEIYGPTPAERARYGGEVLKAFRSVDGVVDVDSTLNPTDPKISLVLDREKAALHGVAPAHVIQTLSMAGQGFPAGSFHVLDGSSQVPVVVQLASSRRRDLRDLLQLAVPGAKGMVPLSQLVTVQEGLEEADIFHKNLMPVSYVFGDLAGRIESPVYALAALGKKIDAIPGTQGATSCSASWACRAPTSSRTPSNPPTRETP